MKKTFVILFCTILSLCSCSSGITPEEARENASTTIADVTYLKNEGIISLEDYNSAIDNIITFEQKSFIGKYWWILLYLFLILVLIGTIEEVTDVEEDQMAKPLTKSKSFWIVGLLGFLGGHYLYLRKCKWIGISTMLLAFLFPLCFYKYFMYFYNLPGLFFPATFDFEQLEEIGIFYKCQSILYIIFVFNILIGIIFVPYWVYQFNGNYFRKHKDNDDILNGKELEVDKFYNSELLPDIKKTNEDAETVMKVLNDEDIVIEDETDEKISGLFKNLFTLGKSSTLKSKVQRLRALRYCCQIISDDIDKFELDNNRLFSYLKYYRVAAYRNLYLAKELIGIVKDKVSSRQQELIIDEFPQLISPKNINPSDVNFDANQISFDSDRFFDSVGQSFVSSFESINSKLEKEKDISKDDFIEAGIEIAFDSIIAGIEGLFDQYSRTTASIKEVEGMINEAVRYLEKAYPAIQRYQAELARQSELMIALYQCNRAFVMAYEPMRQKVFGKPTFSKFVHGINKEKSCSKSDKGQPFLLKYLSEMNNGMFYLNSDDFRKDLQHLILVCTEYNKVYNAKTGNDTNRITKPEYQRSFKKDKKNSTEEKVSYKHNQHAVEVISRENILSIIRGCLKNEHVNEGNSVAYLDLSNRENVVDSMCQQLSTIGNKRIKRNDILKCKNIKEVIDLVI